MNGARPLALLVLATLCCAPATVRADPARQGPTRAVRVAAERCIPAFVEQLAALLRVELGPRASSAPAAQSPGAAGTTRAAGTAVGAIEVALDCAPDDELIAVARAPGAGIRRDRIALARSPSALRPRIAALRVAELVRALDHELARTAQHARAERSAQPAPAVPAGPDAEGEPSERVASSAPFELALLAGAGSFHGDDAWLWGAALAFDHTRGRLALGAEVGFGLGFGRADSPLGQTATFSAQLAPHATWSLLAGRWQLRAGAGCAFGLVRVTAEARAERAGARDLTAPWIAPHALALLGVALGPTLRLQLRVAAGWVALPVVAEVERGSDVALRGLWTQLQLGAALALGAPATR